MSLFGEMMQGSIMKNMLDLLEFSATASTVAPMIIGRFLVGVGIGVSSSVVPLYISEVRLESS